MNKTEDSVLVGFGFESEVLIVGRKRKNQSVEIINAFQGEEALELWKKLTEREDKDEATN